MSDIENSQFGDMPTRDVAKRQTVDTPRGDALDVIGNRFEIQIQNQLPEFSNEVCKAYSVYDRTEEYSDIYALITPNSFPFRDKAADLLKKGTVSSLVRCHATGPATLSNSKKTHRAFIFQKPKGKKLSEIIQHSGALPEAFITKSIIAPIIRVLAALEEQGINHGCINMDTIYFEDDITLDECITAPSGYLQKPRYESPDRLLTMRSAKGAGDTSCDYYAIGILALNLYLGYLPNENLTNEELVETILTKGSYNSFIPEIELSSQMQDLLRGCITNDRTERWNITHLQGWLGGKRYSIVAPSTPKDSVRPFEYRGNLYYTRPQITYSIFKDWKLAKGQVSGYYLMRWLETNIKKTDICSQVDRIIPISDDDSPTRPLKDDELSRLISALAPQFPVRYQLISINIDGLGPALADAFQNNSALHIQQICSMIELNILQYADSLDPESHNKVSSGVLWRIQSLRPILKTKSLGFGYERFLYHFNPSLCCQNEMLLPHYIYTIKDMLTTLNSLAAKHTKSTPLVDRHIAAFLANRLEIEREIRIVELGSFQDLVTEKNLVMLKIITLAQQKDGNNSYPQLAKWAVETIKPILDSIHQTSKRERLRAKIENLTDNGIIERITFLLFNKAMFEFDRREFQRAQALYRFHQEMLQYLTDDKKLRFKARILGQQVAWSIGILVLGVTAYLTSKPFI